LLGESSRILRRSPHLFKLLADALRYSAKPLTSLTIRLARNPQQFMRYPLLLAGFSLAVRNSPSFLRRLALLLGAFTGAFGVLMWRAVFGHAPAVRIIQTRVGITLRRLLGGFLRVGRLRRDCVLDGHHLLKLVFTDDVRSFQKNIARR
jgi:hypothetical protein